MKAVVFHDIGDIRPDDVPEPTLREPQDAIVKITASAICGTDLHMIRGAIGEMMSGTILGHEGVGVVEEVGKAVRNFKSGDTVAVIGCGPAGQFAMLSAFLLGAGRVLAVDCIPCRLDMARELGAEVINFDEEDPVDAVLDMTGGIGVDRAIEAVGVDALKPHGGPDARGNAQHEHQFEEEVRLVAPITRPDDGGHWKPGDAPSQAMLWAVEVLAKAGTLSVIGFYPPSVEFFPFGAALNKNLTINAGNCNHRRYIPTLLELVDTGAVQLTPLVSNLEPLSTAVDAYKAFDEGQTGWIKVELIPELDLVTTR